MPNKNRFFEYQHKQRWSRYLRWHLDDVQLNATRFSEAIDDTPGRVAQCMRGERGVSAQLAWKVGEILRERGARTSGIQALWAAGFFADITLIFGQLAGKWGGSGESSEMLGALYVALPNLMLTFEGRICDEYVTGDILLTNWHDRTDDPDRIVARLCEYSQFALGTDPCGGHWWAMAEKDPWAYAVATIDDLKIRKEIDLAWAAVLRGATPPKVAPSLLSYVDYDLLDAITAVAKKWMTKRVPSIVGVYVWRLLSEFVYPIAGSLDFWYLPYQYLPPSTASRMEFDDESKLSDALASEAGDRYG